MLYIIPAIFIVLANVYFLKLFAGRSYHDQHLIVWVEHLFE